MSKGWSDDEIETAARMYAAGESCRSIGAATRRYKRKSRYMRRCHDCGRPTTDYRCPRCWAKLRSRGGYSPTGEVSDMDTVAYGPAQ